MKKVLFGMLFASMAFGANIALAQDYPESVVGNWSVIKDHFSGTLNITSQGITGYCRPIAGVIYRNYPIQVFYCPVTGRIHFLREIAESNITFQVWAANVSQAGPSLYMGGAVSSDIAYPFGEFNFQAQK